MSRNLLRSAVALAAVALGSASCSSNKPANSVASAPGDTTSGLPFDINDPNATFTAKVVVLGEERPLTGATLSFGGTSYTSDGTGTITVPNVSVDNTATAQVKMDGFMPRTVVLQYARAGARAMRVPLFPRGTVVSFPASAGGSVDHGPVALHFSAGGFVDAAGNAYSGTVNVSALGVDPTGMVTVDTSLRLVVKDGVDRDLFPQGFDMMMTATGSLTAVGPESIFQAELSDPTGAPLQLAPSATATFSLALSKLTQHAAGDSVPLLSFDTDKQHWVEDGSCTVVSNADGSLSCNGSVHHFSTYAIPSGKTASLRCGQLIPVFLAGANRPLSVTAGGTEYKSGKILGIDVREAASGIEVPVSVASADGTRFLTALPRMRATITFGAYRLDGSSAVMDTLQYTFSSQGGNNANDLLLDEAVASSFTQADIDAFQRGATLPAGAAACLPIYVQIPLDDAQAPTDACAGKCQSDEVCNPTTLACSPATPTCSPACDASATCTATNVCTCKTGYTTNGTSCLPTCSTACGANATCTAIDTCTCNSGYSGDGHTCAAVCSPACDTNATCDAPNSCTCTTGYSGDGHTCAPVCTTSCDANASCTAPDTCTCNAGYSGDGQSCTAACNPACDVNATCVSPNVCQCNAGYAGDGYTCAAPTAVDLTNGGTTTNAAYTTGDAAGYAFTVSQDLSVSSATVSNINFPMMAFDTSTTIQIFDTADLSTPIAQATGVYVSPSMQVSFSPAAALTTGHTYAVVAAPLSASDWDLYMPTTGYTVDTITVTGIVTGSYMGTLTDNAFPLGGNIGAPKIELSY